MASYKLIINNEKRKIEILHQSQIKTINIESEKKISDMIVKFNIIDSQRENLTLEFNDHLEKMNLSNIEDLRNLKEMGIKKYKNL